MYAATALRSLRAASRPDVAGVLLIAVVIAGVVLMHSMSGSPSVHLPPPAAVAAHGLGQADPSGATAVGRATVPGDAHDGAGAAHCSSGCGSHDAHGMTAMCLMVLVALLTVAAPRRSLLDAMTLPLARRVLVPEPFSRPVTAPCLHALGISRT